MDLILDPLENPLPVTFPDFIGHEIRHDVIWDGRAVVKVLARGSVDDTSEGLLWKMVVEKNHLIRSQPCWNCGEVGLQVAVVDDDPDPHVRMEGGDSIVLVARYICGHMDVGPGYLTRFLGSVKP